MRSAVRDLAAGAAALRFAALKRVPGFRRDAACRAELVATSRGFLAAARRDGDVETFSTGGRLRAVVASAVRHDPWMGAPRRVLFAEQDLRSPRGRRWLGGALAARFAAATPGVGVELTLAAAYAEHLALARGPAAHRKCALLAGRPRTARRGLGPVDVAAELAARGLETRRLRTAAEVETVLAWKADWFTRNPRFGAHCAHPDYLAAERAEMTGERARPDHDLHLFTRRGRPVAYFSMVEAASAAWGRAASLDLMFTRPWQGRRLARVAYSILVDRMLARGLDGMRGGTSQPGVLALGRRMGRPVYAWVLNAGPAPAGTPPRWWEVDRGARPPRR